MHGIFTLEKQYLLNSPADDRSFAICSFTYLQSSAFVYKSDGDGIFSLVTSADRFLAIWHDFTNYPG